MATLIFSSCGPVCTVLEKPLLQDQLTIQVADVTGFPDLNANPDTEFLVVVYSPCNCYNETLRVTAQNGQIWDVQRAQAGCDVPLTFECGSIVKHPFGPALALSLNEIIACIEEPT